MSLDSVVCVIATCLVSNPSADDSDVAGIYVIELNDGVVPFNRWADAALDVFRSSVPVKVPDDFEFKVTRKDGKEIDRTADHEDGSFKHAGEIVGKPLVYLDASEVTGKPG